MTKQPKYSKPTLFIPTKEDTQKALDEVARHLTTGKVVTSANHPDLKVRGKLKPYPFDDEIDFDHEDDSRAEYKIKPPK